MTALGQSNFLQALGWAVLNSLWQMALLWVIYQAITGIFRSARSSQKSTLATGLLLAGFGWFVFTFFSILASSSSHEAIASGFIDINGNQQLDNWLYQTLPIASVLYLSLLVLPLLHFIRNYRFVQVIRHYGLTKADVEWRMFVNKVSAQMGIKKKVKIWVSEFVTSPVTIGYLKPIILMPLAAMNHLTTQQLEAVLLHELAHIRRADYFINLVIKFIQALLYFNPFVKAFVKIIEREREKSCDETVIQFQYDPHGYASALLVLEKANVQPRQFAMSANGKRHDLLNRIEWIMGVEKKPVISFNKLAGALAGLLCVIALNGFLILSKSKPASEQRLASFSPLASPLYFFTENEPKEMAAIKEPVVADAIAAGAETPQTIRNELSKPGASAPTDRIKVLAAIKPDVASLSPEERVHTMINPFAVAVSNLHDAQMATMPQLNKLEEQQVREAIKASRKVLQETQWKEVEKQIAEVMTQQQKEQLRAEYQKEISKLDWKKWENKLRMAYDRINWDRINNELSVAVNSIRLDSLRMVYSKAMMSLSEVEKELQLNNLEGIPDSDITLDYIGQKKLEVEKALIKIKCAQKPVKKVIHL
jgi:bla regulator protein BlaR1